MVVGVIVDRSDIAVQLEFMESKWAWSELNW